MKRVDKMVSIEFEVEPGGLGVRGLFTLFRGKLKSNKLSKLNNNYTKKCLQRLNPFYYTIVFLVLSKRKRNASFSKIQVIVFLI